MANTEPPIPKSCKTVYMDVDTGDLYSTKKPLSVSDQKSKNLCGVFLFKSKIDNVIFVEEVQTYIRFKDTGRYSDCKALTLDQFQDEYSALGCESLPISMSIEFDARKMQRVHADHSNVINAVIKPKSHGAVIDKRHPSLQTAIADLKIELTHLTKILLQTV